MGSKAPAFQFYPSDWIRDLDEHPLEIEGAWIRICCKLFYSETCGTSTKTLTNWSRILRVGEKKSLSIIDYLDKQKIADVINQNGTITITSRRMVKDEYIRNVRRISGKRGGNPALTGKNASIVLDNQNENIFLNQKQTPSSSSSSSISPIVPTGDETKNSPPPYEKIRQLWSEICPELPQPRKENVKWHKFCKARFHQYEKFKEEGAEWAEKFLRKFHANPWWETGKYNPPGIEWPWRETNFFRILERIE